jgi:hypothetical protein
MVELAAVVIESKQQRSDRVFAALVPAKTGEHTIGSARVLHFDHRAFARLIRRIHGLCNHAVKACALEFREPLGRQRAIARHRRQMNRLVDAVKGFLEEGSPVDLSGRHHVAAVERQQVESHE